MGCYKMSGHKKTSPEFLSFAIAQLEIQPSPTGGEGVCQTWRLTSQPSFRGRKQLFGESDDSHILW